MSYKRRAMLLASTALLLVFVLYLYNGQHVPPRTHPEIPPGAALDSLHASRPPIGNTVDSGPEAKRAMDSKSSGFDVSSCKALTPESFEKAAVTTKMQMAQLESAAEIDGLLARTLASSDPVERAAALYVGAQSLEAKTRAAFDAQAPSCEAFEACRNQANTAAAAAVFKNIDEIANLAVYSTDPRLYALAFHACQRQADPRTGYCSQISATQWAHRDPGNGTAWLYVAGQASRGRRNSEIEEAMFRFSRAKRFDLGLSPLSRLQGGEGIREDNGTVLSAMSTLVNGVLANVTLPEYRSVMDYCQVTALRDPNRRQVCNDIGANLVRDESSLISRALGVTLGERLGWVDQVLNPLREELDAFRALEMGSPGAPNPASPNTESEKLSACLDAAHKARRIENRMRLGEIGALRIELDEQPVTRKALAEKYRAYARQVSTNREVRTPAANAN